ncbi:bifunctional phosphoglucose/phosphomannose isomerase, partial [Candidatus Woesearchaeota archaeon]|nr:bifunctional phosphoglucose/phosphomannose isomerase [Candidatus Woesearchaeota archaeon]
MTTANTKPMDYLHIIEDMPHQIRDAIKLAQGTKVEGEIDNILVTGMGGSGIPADILRTVMRDTKTPVFVNKDYSLPNFVNDKTLLFAISYSGNTEETLAAYKEATKKRAKIVCICSGGKLKQTATEAKLIIVPEGMPPRSAIAYLLFPALIVLHNSKLLKLNRETLIKTIDALHAPELKQKAQDLAEQLFGKIPLIYASPAFEAIALRWKQAINENSKQHAFWNVFPEMNHNEMMAYTRPQQGFHAILLRDENDSPRLQKRISLTKEIIKKQGTTTTEIMLKGESLLVKMMTAIFLGDLTSYYLGIKNKVNPEETKLIE